MQFPLKNGQLGYMNHTLQSFLGFNNSELCYSSRGSNLNKKLKVNTPCILRMGVEKNRNQSFLCMLASVYKFYNKSGDNTRLTSQIESLSEFKQYFLSNLTIDKFLTAQNGILPEVLNLKIILLLVKYLKVLF